LRKANREKEQRDRDRERKREREREGEREEIKHLLNSSSVDSAPTVASARAV
jgi:hypothetical protein